MATTDLLNGVSGDLAFKAPVICATTTSIALTGLLTVDGVTVTEGQRVLVMAQSDATQNGIYNASSGTWSRAADADGTNDWALGTQVLVALGSMNAGLTYAQSCADSPIVVGTSLITFTEKSSFAAIRQSATSGSSLTIGLGAQTLGIQSGKAFQATQYVVIYRTSDRSKAMLGQITSYTGGTLVVNVVSVGGSGTFTDWSVVLANSPAAAGIIPPLGTGNVVGLGGAAAGHLATFADLTGLILADGGAAGALANLSALTAKYLASSALSAFAPMINGTIVASVGSSQLTVAIKTLAGADPSPSDPVLLVFRNATAATGNFVVITLTAAFSVVVPSTALVGFSNLTPGRIWFGALLNGSTPEGFVVNCLNGKSIYPLQGWGIFSTSVLDATADSAGTPYSTTSRSNVPYVALGYLTWEAGLTVAGTWDALPTRIQLAGWGTPLPGTVVQVASNTSTTVATTTSGTFAALSSGQTQTIGPTSAANLVRVTSQGTISNSNSANMFLQLARTIGASTSLIGNPVQTNEAGDYPTALVALDAPGTTSTVTYSYQGKVGSGTLSYPLTATGVYLELQELMA